MRAGSPIAELGADSFGNRQPSSLAGHLGEELAGGFSLGVLRLWPGGGFGGGRRLPGGYLLLPPPICPSVWRPLTHLGGP